MKRIYQELELESYEAVGPEFQKYADRSKSYKTNRYEISDEIRDEIAKRWRPYFEKYGYAVEGEASEQSDSETETRRMVS